MVKGYSLLLSKGVSYTYIHTYIQCDLLDPGTSWVFCLAMGRELATLDYLHGSQLVVGI